MYESTSDIDEDFFDAIVLLHSTEQDSAEKLRRMLDACIERRHGPGKTLAVRMPKRFLQNVDESALPMQTSKKQDYVTQERSAIKTEIWDPGDPEIISLFKADKAENIRNHRMPDVKMFEIDYENCCEDEDIPRISIPDEGSADGTVCKVFFN